MSLDSVNNNIICIEAIQAAVLAVQTAEIVKVVPGSREGTATVGGGYKVEDGKLVRTIPRQVRLPKILCESQT